MTFFEEFRKLKNKTPHIGIRGFQNTACEYDDYLYFSKNCYMCFIGDKLQNCFYCMEDAHLKDCCDCSTCEKCELCYGCLDCNDCYDGTYLQDCRRVSQSLFCYDCIGCNNCFGCAGLRQKNYCLFNEQLDEKTYNEKVREWKMKGLQAIWNEFEKVKLKIPHQHLIQYRVDNSYGDHLEEAQRAYCCFSSVNLQDCGYLNRVYTAYGDKNVDTWDIEGGVDLQTCYEGLFPGKAYNSNFLYYCEFVRDCDYCFQVFNSKHCFGCVGVNHGEYMILNQKYEPEAWARKKAEIIEQMKKDGEWGKWPLIEGEKFDTD